MRNGHTNNLRCCERSENQATEHEHHAKKKWRGAQHPHLLDAARRSGANHGRNPEHKAVHAEAPAEILEAKKEYARHAQCRA